MQKTWLVVYDISDSKRLQQVHRIVKDYGDGIQKSVFLCQLSPSHLSILQDKISSTIHYHHDQVIFIPLHRTDKYLEVDRWETYGRRVYESESRYMIY